MIGLRQIGGSDARAFWPVVGVLLLVVLAPTVCVIWFMNEAVGNERLAIRQRMRELYQGELVSRQKRLDGHWEKAIEALGAGDAEGPAGEFERLVHAGFSSALIYREGKLVYPALVAGPGEGPMGARWREAEGLEAAGDFAGAAEAYEGLAFTRDSVTRTRALVGEMRALFRGGETKKALEVLNGPLQGAECAQAADGAGRLLVPSAMLLGIESLPVEAEWSGLVKRLAERLRDYGGPAMPCAQRLFLMERVAAIAGEKFETMEGERLGLEIAGVISSGLAAGWNAENGGVLQAVPGMPGRWMMGDGKGQVVGIWTSAAVQWEFGKELQLDVPAGTAMGLVEPGKADTGAFLSVPAGKAMPGWNVELYLTGPDPFGAAARRREAGYWWAACLSIGAIAALAGVLGMYLRRQMRLTRLKNDLIATVSHELKTPLSSMRVLIDTLVEGRVSPGEAEQEYLGMIARENMRLSRLIDNFLTFSRMERKKEAFGFRALAVSDVVREAVEAMGERGAEVRVEVMPGLMVWGDADALATVVLNLLDNAWKYSREDRRIELTGRRSGESVEIAVRDFGIGIARRHQRRIFQRFYQVDRELSRQTGGCGLGLAIVQFIVKAHRGTVHVKSRPGEGSTFFVVLPAMEMARATTTREETGLEAASAGGPRHHG